MSTAISDILGSSNIQFGTSGARGLVTDFTPEVCAAFTQSFLQGMQQRFSFKHVALAIDNRPSSVEMVTHCIGMVEALGLDAQFYGVLPTPALALQALKDNVPAIMITGSHIPFDRNGIKFYRPDGEISKADEALILGSTNTLLSFTSTEKTPLTLAAENYVKRYLNLCQPNLLQGKHIGVYEHSSAGKALYHQLFTQLGAKVTRLEATDYFVPIDTEAVSEEDKLKAQNWSKAYQFDAIFSTDGDGDRPLIADENGNWLRGDTVGLLTAMALRVEALAVPVNCNSAIDLCGAFKKVARTQIGSPYVIAKLQQLVANYQSVAGFEANGGFLLSTDLTINKDTLAALPTRDALLPFIAIMQMATDSTISSLTAALPQRFTASQRLQSVPRVVAETLLAKATVAPDDLLAELGQPHKVVSQCDLTDGVRLTLADGDIIHFRPSGNAPELRVYAEAASQQTADALALIFQQQLSNWLDRTPVQV
ncbi:phosphomannomutase [Alishewanella sp. HL-SH06]|uniref:phosphomannomutase n=1 Tax=Alishewanella sp. HL-SH06 TaxID=3461144 RepID=UPI00404361B6